MAKLPICLLVTGVLLLAASLVAWLSFPSLMKAMIRGQVNLQDGSPTFEKWKDITMPILMSYYFYNITNSDEVEKGRGAVMPKLDEIGPYVYLEKRAKTVHSMNEEKDTVTYQQSITYFFQPDLSNGTEADILRLINIPLVGLANKGIRGDLTTSARSMANEEIQTYQEKLFMTHNVSEMLFAGYHEPVLEQLGRLQGAPILPDNRFGLAYGKNGTLGPMYEVNRGLDDNSQFGNIVSWREEPKLDWWWGDACNMINGTDGSIFPPFVTRDRVLSLFSDDLCRSLYLYYEKDIDYNGIPAYRFSVPEKVFQKATINPDNLCFCRNQTNGGEFCKAGVIDLGACKKGAPIFASTPHFLFGEEEDAQKVGLAPDPERHMTYIDLEPNTGVLLQASKKIQINVQVKPYKNLHNFKYAPDVLLPIMWADEYAALTPDKVELVKSKVLSPPIIFGAAKWVVIGLSLVVISVGVIVLVLQLRSKQKKSRAQGNSYDLVTQQGKY